MLFDFHPGILGCALLAPVFYLRIICPAYLWRHLEGNSPRLSFYRRLCIFLFLLYVSNGSWRRRALQAGTLNPRVSSFLFHLGLDADAQSHGGARVLRGEPVCTGG